MKRRCALALAALAISPFGCGGATTSTPPGPQPLEIDAGGDDDVDASEPKDASPASEARSDASDADDADVVLTECPGFVEPDSFASCSQNSMNNQCNVTCRSGGRTWQSQCRDGVCSCAMGIEVKCKCTMAPGLCRSCCPGMVVD